MLKFFKKIFTPFSKVSSSLGTKLRHLFSKKIDEESLEELEKLFYEADLGATLSYELTQKVKKFATAETPPQEILQFIKKELLSYFPEPKTLKLSSPHIILVVGINGSGKTTSLAKLAHFYKLQGKSVLIAAGDTFRAAAVEQLESWAEKLSIPIVKSKTHSDPSAIAFDALTSALSKKTDVVLIDTAGRLQNKTDLMHELAKIQRVIQKKIPDAPHETLLVLDATVGQNAIDQAKTFHQFAPLTGIVLTKLDGSAKGGIAVSLQKELPLPILWAGIGEKEEDFIPFDPIPYLDALLGLS